MTGWEYILNIYIKGLIFILYTYKRKINPIKIEYKKYINNLLKKIKYSINRRTNACLKSGKCKLSNNNLSVVRSGIKKYT